MDNNLKTKLYIAGGVILTGVLLTAIYFTFFRDKSIEQESIYPQSVQEAIDHPVEKNGNWSTLVDDEEYQISYSTSSTGDSFFITVNAAPVLEVSLKAEGALLQKLGTTDHDYLCSLPVIINIPYMIDQNLSEYNFGLSFCPNRIHVSDIPQAASPDDQTNINLR